jgi:hypothetical protein
LREEWEMKGTERQVKWARKEILRENNRWYCENGKKMKD